MIRMEIGAQITHRHVAVGCRLDRSRAKPTGGITVDQQSQHHRRRMLLAPGAAVVDLEVVGRDPFLQISFIRPTVFRGLIVINP